jgi:hypothetical protein
MDRLHAPSLSRKLFRLSERKASRTDGAAMLFISRLTSSMRSAYIVSLRSTLGEMVILEIEDERLTLGFFWMVIGNRLSDCYSFSSSACLSAGFLAALPFFLSTRSANSRYLELRIVGVTSIPSVIAKIGARIDPHLSHIRHCGFWRIPGRLPIP